VGLAKKILIIVIIQVHSAEYLQECNPFQDQIRNSSTRVKGSQLQRCYTEQIDKSFPFILISDFKPISINVLKEGREGCPYPLVPTGIATDEEMIFPIIDAKPGSHIALARPGRVQECFHLKCVGNGTLPHPGTPGKTDCEFSMHSACKHVGIEADDIGAVFPANALETLKKCVPVVNHAPGRSDFTLLDMSLHVSPEPGES
jgi:hypothetical protein